MRYSLLFVPFLMASGHAKQDDVYKMLNLSDRVQITFHSGNMITGKLVASPVAQKAKPLAKDGSTSPAAPAFVLRFFQKEDDKLSQTQEVILEQWMKKHAEGKLEGVKSGTQPDLWKTYEVAITPTLVFEMPGFPKFVALVGVHSEIRLDEALTGLRASAPAEGKIDYTKEKALTLDLSWEYPGLNGTMTVNKDQIKEIRKLQNLDKATLERLEKLKVEIEKQKQKDEEDRKKAEGERTKRAEEEAKRFAKEQKAKEDAATQGDVVKQLEQLKEGFKSLQKFPPPTWGAEKLKEISEKARRKQPVTPDEIEFTQVYDLWLKAKEAQDKEKKKGPESKEEKPPEEKKP